MRTNNRPLLIILTVLILVVLIGPFLVGGLMGPGMMGPGMMWGPGMSPETNGWAWGLAMALGMLMMLAFWGALIVGIVLLIRWLAGMTTRSAGAGSETASDIVRRRYAAGEISREEYEHMRHELEH